MAYIMDQTAKWPLSFPSIYHAGQNEQYEDVEREQNHQGTELVHQRLLLKDQSVGALYPYTISPYMVLCT